MKIELDKQSIIEEMAVHANHPMLNKQGILSKTAPTIIKNNRQALADNINKTRKLRINNNPQMINAREHSYQSNAADNTARLISSTGNRKAEYINPDENKPRMVQSAKV